MQVINISNTPWVCASNILSSPDVEVCDSLPHLSMELRSLQSQIVTILNCKEKMFQINHIDVQRQQGESDCGLFAIAHATIICLGGDPHTAYYCQSDLRNHLEQCYKERKMTAFPRLYPRRKKKHYYILNTHMY